MATKPTQDLDQKKIVIEDTESALNAPVRVKEAHPIIYPLSLPETEERKATPAVGQSASRPDARLHGLGQTKYIDDIKFPNMIYAKVLRSEKAHAKIISIDTSEAEAMPGVYATLTGKEIPTNTFGPTFQDQPVLSDTVVRHRGDGVAAVAAVSEQVAQEALKKIKVVYEDLPVLLDPEEALKDEVLIHPPKSNIYTSKVIKKGDVEKGLAESDHIFTNRYKTQFQEHVPIEPHASIALWDGNGRVTLWSSLGRITLGREDMSRTLNLPQSKIRMIGTIVGGNFGGKNEITNEPILALLSKKTGRPVKCTYTREDEFVSSTIRHPFIMDFTTGVNKEGKILARKIKMILDGGAYCSWTGTTIGKGSILAAGPYNIDNLQVESYAVYTNKTTTGAMRGFGAPQVCFAYESQMDEIAKTLGIDPLEIRLRNAFREGSLSPTSQTLHSVVVEESLLQAAEAFGWNRS
ncbi:MAG: xanthine dehydrogenase family protein molybdopterin-binding subunit [Gammaproteobacteria bacterium]